jgi:hypothetical protein
MKKLFAMIMVMCLVMGLCACGGGDGKTDSTGDANTAKSIAGRYEIYAIQFQGQVMDKEELTDREVDETVILKEDGTGTWFLEGDEIAVTYDEKTIIDSDLNEPYNYEVKDGILTIIVGEDATYSYKLVS